MNKPILLFTLKASEHIKKSLTGFPGGGFRLSIKKAGCTGHKYVREVLAAPKAGDYEFLSEQGFRVFIPEDSVAAVTGATVDLVTKGLGQTQLEVSNPNVVDSCGCGESFLLKDHTHE